MSNLKVATARKLDIPVVKSMFSPAKMCGLPQGKRYRSYSATVSSGASSLTLCSAHGKLESSGETQIPTSTHQKHYGGNISVGDANLLKRRHGSFTGGECGKYNSSGQFKRRKKEPGIVRPTKFLLGGNINDPLNLNSLVDSHAINQVTPKTSPVPIPKHRTQVEVLIPPNINDPLNLNGGEEDAELELNLISPKTKKRNKRRKKRKSSSMEVVDGSEAKDKCVDSEKDVQDPSTQEPTAESSGLHLDLQVSIPVTSQQLRQKKLDDKIVSPVIPQPGMRKHRPSGHSKGASREGDRDVNNQQCLSSYLPPIKPLFKKRNEQFRYGNYDRYYGYRNPELGADYRLDCFKPEWFKEKDVLDIGCNIGHVTLSIARDFAPKKVIGVDIDDKLVRVARKNVVHYLKAESIDQNKFPISLAICYGPITTAAVLRGDETPKFPNNVCFVQGNYILDSDELLEEQRPEFDTIVCLSLTKWVHLNWGDDGLKRLFKRIFRQLRPGGKLILEAQAWPSYAKKKKLTEAIFETYQKLKLRPEKFTEYLLSKEVGFSTCAVIGTPFNLSKGFRRPMHLFTKGENTPSNSPPMEHKGSTCERKAGSSRECKDASSK